MVADYVSGIVSQFGAGTFKAGEVVSDVVLKALEGLWQAFVECLMNLSVVVIDRKMAKQMLFEVIDGVQADKVDPNGVMEVFEVYPETEITRISSPGDNISFAGIQIRIQGGYEFSWKLGTESFNRSEILLFAFCELCIVGTK